MRSYLSTANTYTLYDEAGHWVGDYGANGTPVQQAIWMDDLPVGLRTAAAGTVSYIEPDHLGSPRVVIDPVANTAIWKWDIKGEAFGASAPEQDPDGSGRAFNLDMRFPGQRYDQYTGLNFNYFRDYEPGSGRYVESDPVGLNGGISTYAYAGSNSIFRIDPSGLDDTALILYGAGVIDRMPERKGRLPDYVKVSVNFYVGQVSFSRARNGHTYIAGGFIRGYPHSLSAGISASAGWLNQTCKPSSEKLDRFNTGQGMSVATAYADIGGGLAWSPGEGSATEVGVGWGVSATGGLGTGGVGADTGYIMSNDGWGWSW